jgi:hypothetical protein
MAPSVNGCFFGLPLTPTVEVVGVVAFVESSAVVVEDEDVSVLQPTAKMAANSMASNGEDFLMDGVPASNKHDQLRDVTKLAMPRSTSE